jgi:hypothetical protein
MRVHPPVRAQNAAFAVEYRPGHITSQALKELILVHKVVMKFPRSIWQRYEFEPKEGHCTEVNENINVQ